MQTVYITKYALTVGIIEAQMQVNGDTCWGQPEGHYHKTLFFKGQFFLTKEEALQNCELRRDRELKSLRKKIAKIEELAFNL